MQVNKITVCGGGNGAQTTVPIAAQNMGCEVDWYAPFGDEADRLRAALLAHSKIETLGAVQASAAPRRISADPAQVIPGSEIVLLVLPAFAHETTLQEVIPYLDRGAWLGAMPARGGFDYCAARVLDELNRDDIGLFGLQTLPWACRILEFGKGVQVLGVKAAVDAASRPKSGFEQIRIALKQMLGLEVGHAGSFLALNLANTGQLIHPGIMYSLFCDWDGRVYRKDEIPLFYQGLDEQGARVLEVLSQEMQALRSHLENAVDLTGVRPLKAWMLHSYGEAVLDSSNLRQVFVSNQAYAGLKAPMKRCGEGVYTPDFGARYLAEDVPFGLVVSRAIADLAGVTMPMADKVIRWAGNRLGKRFLERDAGGTRIPQNYGLESLPALITFEHET